MSGDVACAMTHLYTRTLGFSMATGPAVEVDGCSGRWSNSISITSIVVLPTLWTRWISGLSVQESENTSPGDDGLGASSASPSFCPGVGLFEILTPVRSQEGMWCAL